MKSPNKTMKRTTAGRTNIARVLSAVAASLGRGDTATERRGYNKAAAWKFTRWDLIDLANFKVKLKAEFQGSNRDLYRPEAIVASSAK